VTETRDSKPNRTLPPVSTATGGYAPGIRDWRDVKALDAEEEVERIFFWRPVSILHPSARVLVPNVFVEILAHRTRSYQAVVLALREREILIDVAVLAELDFENLRLGVVAE
jgi:hypothetical protein